MCCKSLGGNGRAWLHGWRREGESGGREGPRGGGKCGEERGRLLSGLALLQTPLLLASSHWLVSHWLCHVIWWHPHHNNAENSEWFLYYMTADVWTSVRHRIEISAIFSTSYSASLFHRRAKRSTRPPSSPFRWRKLKIRTPVKGLRQSPLNVNIVVKRRPLSMEANRE